jgi:hypothetical protein
MSGDPAEVHAATAVLDHHEHIERRRKMVSTWAKSIACCRADVQPPKRSSSTGFDYFSAVDAAGAVCHHRESTWNST